MTHTAKIYGSGLYDLAMEDGLVDVLMEQLQQVRSLFRENPDPNEEEIKEYLSGNLCRCSGYEGQLRGIQAFLEWKKGGQA